MARFVRLAHNRPQVIHRGVDPFLVLALCLGVVAFAIAAVAVAYALKAYAKPVKHSQSILALRAEFAELMDDVEKLTHLVSKKSNRDQMREARSNGADPYALKRGETPDQWKARMRAGVQSGAIKPPRFTG